MSKKTLNIPTITVLTHSSRPNCYYCNAPSANFCSIYIPINDKNIQWEFPKTPTTLNLKIFEGYYALTICTVCNHILDD